jgi:hypothetical protein
MYKRGFFEWIHDFKVLMSNWALFIVIFASLFVWPFFGGAVQEFAFDLFISAVIILSVFAVAGERNNKQIFQFGITLAAIWLTRLIEMPLFNGILRFVVIIYFISVVFKFIKLVYKRVNVDRYVIIEAVNGYLLLGIGFSLLVAFSNIYFPNAFSFKLPHDGSVSYDPIYFSFVTLTTLGYGDKLPISDVAKSVSLLITLSGQFYLVTIMAFIVGKMLTKTEDK